MTRWLALVLLTHELAPFVGFSTFSSATHDDLSFYFLKIYFIWSVRPIRWRTLLRLRRLWIDDSATCVLWFPLSSPFRMLLRFGFTDRASRRSVCATRRSSRATLGLTLEYILINFDFWLLVFVLQTIAQTNDADVIRFNWMGVFWMKIISYILKPRKHEAQMCWFWCSVAIFDIASRYIR